MVKSINLIDKNVRFSCKFYCNDVLAKESKASHEHNFIIPELPAHCKIEINPWKIKPYVRFDNQLVNYGLAKIIPWDHMLEFTIYEDFLDRYFNAIVKAKKDYLINTDQTVPVDMEYFVGVNNFHPELVNKIYKRIK